MGGKDLKIAIFGIGNYSEVMVELCLELNLTITGLYHFDSSRNGEMFCGFEILGDYNDFITSNEKTTGVVVAVGDNKTRDYWLNKLFDLGYSIPNLIHPTAHISKSVRIGNGVYIHPRAFIWSGCEIANNVIISPNATIAHHVKIGDGCLISANATVGSYVQLGRRVLVGLNSGIISKNILIDDDSVIGANAMVLKNFPKNSKIVGTPAKHIDS